MKWVITFLLSLLVVFCAKGQTLYSRAYGIAGNPAVIFIHGGPGGNATLFEATTAPALANKGFYVIVYDRRGEGRSIDTTATFTYQEAITDLNTIYRTWHIEKASLIGHSFGGLVATLYTDKHPEKVSALVLAGALVAQQETYNHILKKVKQVYKSKKDTGMLATVAAIEKLDKHSAAYRKACFDLAGKNNFFNTPVPTAHATGLRQAYEAGTLFQNNIRNNQAPLLFYKNEIRNNIDTRSILRGLNSKGVKLFALYGQQDGIFSAAQLHDISNITGSHHFRLLKNCSHYLFVDQQEQFIERLETWLQ